MFGLAPDALLLPDWLWVAVVVVFVLYLAGVRVEFGETPVTPETDEDRRVRRAVEAYVSGEIDVDGLELRLDLILRPYLFREGDWIEGPDGERVRVYPPPKPRDARRR